MKKKLLPLPLWCLAILLISCSLAAQDRQNYPWPHQGPDLEEIQVEQLRSEIQLSRIFGQMYIDENNALRSMDGLELLLEADTPIYAIRDGTVLHIDQNLVVIGTPFERPDSLYWSFTQPFAYYDGLIPAADLQLGQFVRTGHQIGTVSLTETAPNRFFIGLGSNYFNQSTFPDGLDFSQRHLLNFISPLIYFTFPDTHPPQIASSLIIASTTLAPLDSGEPLSQKVHFFVALHDTGESYMPRINGYTDFGFPPSLIEGRVIPRDPANTNLYNPIYSVRLSSTGCKDGMLTYFQYIGPSTIYHLSSMQPILQDLSDTEHFPYWVGSLSTTAMEDGPYTLEITATDYHNNVCTASYSFSINNKDVIIEKKGKDKR